MPEKEPKTKWWEQINPSLLNASGRSKLIDAGFPTGQKDLPPHTRVPLGELIELQQIQISE